ncbi:MAG: PqqD family protein [Marinilabiliales bacterium]|nr:PqqD family protein [Marinilabiliales bacterium]
MRIKSNLKIREVAGEKLVILERAGQVDLAKMLVLNDTSEWLWNGLAGTDFSVADVTALLLKRFEVDEQQASIDASNWISQLQQYDIFES